jgi:2-polyprenyl-6-methoxyphenol hydroxylase-like FAD-dependent oxidoreductase
MRVMRTIIHDILLQRLEEEGITLKYGMHLTKIEESSDSVEVTFADGTTDTADLLIGADGIHSAVRSTHVDPGSEPEYTGLSSLYSIIPFDSLTSPIYFSGNFGTVIFRKGMFGTGFCDKQRTKMYWFNTHTVPAKGRDGWIAYGNELETIRNQLVKNAEEVTVPLIHEILEKSPEIRFYPIYRLPLKGKWFTRRTLLIGDAAHGTSSLIKSYF